MKLTGFLILFLFFLYASPAQATYFPFADGINVGIGTTDLPQARLQVGAGPGPTRMVPTGHDAYVTGNLEVDGILYGDGSLLSDLDGITSVFTPQYIPVAVSATLLTDSIFYQSAGGNIGLGTSDPQAFLEVFGPDVRITAANVRGAVNRSNSSGTGAVRWQTTSATEWELGLRTAGLADLSLYSTTLGWDLVTLKAEGNIGLGTILPNAGLELRRSGSVPAFMVSSAATVNGDFLSITSSGNVGVGTTDPQALFQIGSYPTAVAASVFINNNNSSNTTYQILTGSGGGLRFAVTDAGNVGVGSTVPLARLQVGTAPAVVSGSLPELLVKNDMVVDGAIYGDGGPLTALNSLSGLSAGQVPLALSAVSLGNASIYQDSNGNVGIGTAVPLGGLDINGALGLRLDPHGANTMTLRDDDGALVLISTQTATSTMKMLAYDDNIYIQNTNATGRVYLTGNSGATLSGRVLMVLDGNVGINSSLPVAKIDVTGSGTTTTAIMNLKDSTARSRLIVLANGNVGIGTTVFSKPVTLGVGTARFNSQVLMMPSDAAPALTPADSRLAIVNPDFGANSSGVFVYRSAASGAANGGNAWTPAGVDTAFLARSIEGNAYSAAVAAYSGLDHGGSAALVAATSSNPYAFLGYNHAGDVHAAVFINGNVGVGTFQTNAPLEVVKSGANPLFMVSSAPGSDGDWLAVRSSGNVGIGTGLPAAILEIQDDTVPLLMVSSGTGANGDWLAVGSSGNVGIGSPMPEGGLDVTGSTGANLIKIAALSDSGSTTVRVINGPSSPGWIINGYGSSASLPSYLGFLYNNIANVLFRSNGNVGIGSSAPPAVLEIERRGAVSPFMVSSHATTDGDHLIVTSSGNVGIGSTVPSSKFGGNPWLVTDEGNEGAYSFDYTINKAGGDDTGLLIGMTNTSSPGVSRLIDAQVNGLSQFEVRPNSAYFSGNLGVGTFEPAAGLEVQRTGGTTPFIVSSSSALEGDYLVVSSGGDVNIAGASLSGIQLDVSGSAILKGASGDTEGELVYDTATNKYKYRDDIQWNDLTGGIITFTSTLWLQAGTNLYYIGGNVGIGTSVPDDILSLAQTADANGIKIYGFDDKSASYVQANVNAAGDAQIKSTGAMLLDATGNVGINTASPLSLLHVSAGDVLLDNSRSIHSRRYWGRAIRDIVQYNSANTLVLASAASGRNLIIKPSGTERVRMPWTGNTGIGTLVPNSTLEVQATAGQAPFLISSSGSENGDYLTVASDGNVGIGSAVPEGGLNLTGFGVDTGLALATRNSAQAIQTVVQDMGNVGLGTSVPNKALVVHGLDGQQFRLGLNRSFYWDITRNASGTLEYYSSDGGAGNKMGMKNDGNLGVGTVLPDGALSVRTIGQAAVLNVYGLSASPDAGVVQVSTAGSLANAAARWLVLQRNAGNVGIGTISPQALFQVGTAPAVMAGSSPGMTVKGDIEADGEIYLSNSSRTVWAASELVMRQDGDTQGASALTLHNRDTDEFGAVLSTFDAAELITDLIFRTSSLSRYVRFDNRASGPRTGDPSFHIGGASVDSPTLAVGDSYAAVGNMLRVGAYTAPGQTLSVTGTASFTGNVGIGTTVTDHFLQAGLATPTVTAGSSPVAAVKGNVMVDGKIYGNASTMTIASGGIYGLTPGYVPKAASASTLNDSNIYQDGSNNIGIGTSVAAQVLNVKGNTKVAGQLSVGTYALSDGATIAVNWDNGNTQYVTLGGNRQVTFSNPAADTHYYLVLTQDGAGTRTITSWPTITWAGGSAPVLTTTAAKADIVSCLYMGSTYYCDISQNF